MLVLDRLERGGRERVAGKLSSAEKTTCSLDLDVWREEKIGTTFKNKLEMLGMINRGPVQMSGGERPSRRKEIKYKYKLQIRQ